LSEYSKEEQYYLVLHTSNQPFITLQIFIPSKNVLQSLEKRSMRNV